MPIFMDLHIVPGVSAKEVAEAHILDVKIQHKYCCKAMTYWIDEERGSVFCLIEAPDKESVRELHAQSHGLIPNEIIQVNTDVVSAFLGRITDPENAIPHPDTNLKVFSDKAYRVILMMKTADTRLLQHGLGKERAQELLLLYSTIVQEQCRTHEGREVFMKQEGFVMSFESASKAITCALTVQKKLSKTAQLIGLRVGLHAGEPVANSGELFGGTVSFAKNMCLFSQDGQITMSSDVRDLYKDHDWNLTVEQDNVRCLTLTEGTFLMQLGDALMSHWQNAEFDVPDFCQVMSISKPQLYRKCVALTGLSPNALLREYRLLQSLNLLRQEDRNVAQTTFDTGFSSPSYFTKCFQKRFGIQPLAYLKERA